MPVLKRRPIVVAESNFLTGRLLVASLQAGGRPAVVGRDGDSVLRLLETHAPELLILNMNLARPNGIELLRTIRQRKQNVRILAATAPGQAEVRAAAGALGVSDFMEFPFAPAELNDQVGRLLKD
jgi:DNA-binding response OmpR family regulator